MKNVARRIAVKQREIIRHAAPAHPSGRSAVHGGQVHQQLLQRSGRRRRVRKPVHPQAFGGDALADLRVVIRLREQFQVGVRMHVDETRADYIPAGIYYAPRRNRRHVAGQYRQGVARNRHAPPVRRGPRSVYHAGVGE